jgi:hypothetical protein
VEIGGMFSPAGKIDEMVDSVKAGKIRSVDELYETLGSIYSNYHNYAWVWCSDLISRQAGHKPENMPVSSLIQIITDWKTFAIKLNNMVQNDAEKEFDTGSRIGFGIDGDAGTRDDDFRTVRGEFDTNKFVLTLQKESKEIEEKADRLIGFLEKLSG